MIQTLQSLSPPHSVGLGMPQRGPSKAVEGGFALVMQNAPGHLTQEAAPSVAAQKTPPIAPGVDLAGLLRGAIPVAQDQAATIETGIPAVETLTDAAGIDLPDATSPQLPADAPQAVVTSGAGPAALSGNITTLPAPEGLMIAAASADISAEVTEDGQITKSDISEDLLERINAESPIAETGDPALATTGLAMLVKAPGPQPTDAAFDAIGLTQDAAASPSLTPPIDAAKFTETSPNSVSAAPAEITGESDIPAMPATADPETGQGTGQGMGQNSGKSSEQPPSDASKLPIATEGQPPMTAAVSGASVTHAPSGVQFDMTQQNATAQGGQVLDMQDPQWTRDLGLIAEDVMRNGTGELELKLNPERLGAMTLRIDMTDGRASVTIVTETPEAAKLMMDNQVRLSEQMQRSGFDLSQTVSHNGTSGGSEGQSSRRGGQSGSDAHGQGKDQQNSMPDTDETRSLARSGVDLVA